MKYCFYLKNDKHDADDNFYGIISDKQIYTSIMSPSQK